MKFKPLPPMTLIMRHPLPLEDLVELCASIKRQTPFMGGETLERALQITQRQNRSNGGTTSLSLPQVVLRLQGRMKMAGECWEVEPGKGRRYPTIYLCGYQVKASRFVYAWSRGAVPRESLVCHECDNPKCCNPKHLFLGSHLENSKDKYAKGRANHAKGRRVNTCKLTSRKVAQVRALLDLGFGIRPLGRMFSVSHKAIHLIKTNKNWKPQ